MKIWVSGILWVFVLSSCAHLKNGFYVKRESGSSFAKLAKDYSISEDRLRASNGDKTFSQLKWVFIPRRVGILGYWQLKQPEQTVVAEVESEERSPVKPIKSKKKAVVVGKDPTPVKVSKKLNLIWPVPSAPLLSSRYGMRHGRMHRGVDIPAPIGTPIVASESGKVIYSDSKISGYGKMTIIAHENDYLTVYAHASENLFNEGDYVKKGDVIALVGQTGRATGPHLHYEVRKKEKAIDPMKFLKIPSKKTRSVASRTSRKKSKRI